MQTGGESGNGSEKFQIEGLKIERHNKSDRATTGMEKSFFKTSSEQSMEYRGQSQRDSEG